MKAHAKKPSVAGDQMLLLHVPEVMRWEDHFIRRACLSFSFDVGVIFGTERYQGPTPLPPHGNVTPGRPWSTMVDLGRPWSTMLDHVRPWSTDLGRPWSTMLDRGRPWSTMVDHGRPSHRGGG